MSKLSPAKAVALSLLLCVACGDDDGPSTDAGSTPRVDGGGSPGVDSGMPPGVDAGTADSGTEVDGGSAPETDSGPPMMTDGGPPSERIDTALEDIAAAICGALLRCCDDGESAEQYFAAPRMNTLAGLEALRPRMPPNMPLSAETCPALVEEIITIRPFGEWVEQAALGRVTVVDEEYDACLSDLEDATCGREVSDALFDPTCFAFLGDASGGDNARTWLRRFRDAGETCAALNDGQNGLYYGTCDPSDAYCCVLDPEDPDAGCQIPQAGDVGTCVEVVEEGCSLVPLVRCESGFECIGDGPCMRVEEVDAGEDCSGGFAYCTQGEAYCDVFDSNQCQPLRADGAPCMIASQCESEFCDDDGMCAPSPFCNPG